MRLNNFTKTNTSANGFSTANMAERPAVVSNVRFGNWLKVLSVLLLVACGTIGKSYAANTEAFGGGNYAAGNVCKGATAAVIQTFSLVCGTTNHSVTNFTFTTAAGYAAADVTQF